METYKIYLEKYSNGVIGFNTFGILVQSCLGSIAAMAILMNGNSPMQMVQLFLVTIICMGFNGAVLSQQKPKIAFNILLISLTFCSVISILNLLFL
jgi:hypothetical protein